ncbi:hypothetical protein CKO09_04925 [Chromatium weissei]|nr:hypothetical protein [Chromatium weissei]
MNNAQQKVIKLVLLLALCGGISSVFAEEYMKRGASVDDYEQALNRVMERKRGLVTGRELQTPAEKPAAAPARKPTAAPPSRSTANAPAPAPRRHKVVENTEKVPSPAAAPKPKRQFAPNVYTPPANTTADTADGVSIYFGYNSARLTKDAMSELGKLGKALTSPQFNGIAWLVEGHSDDAGSAAYNQELSEQRAQAARLYLIEMTGIAPERLNAVGKGESEPFDRANPRASINRRVRLRPDGN